MIRLDERLKCALDLLQGTRTVADIGSDHGKLTAALLLEGRCERVIAGDISRDCLQKTCRLIDSLSLQNRAKTRLGSGLSILAPGECDAAAVMGMGGELITELLRAAPATVKAMDRIVLQPMSGMDKLRKWLYENCFHVMEDRLAVADGRWYQVICVQQRDLPDIWPERFPQDCWIVGYRSFQNREKLLGPYCDKQLQKRYAQIKQAAGTPGEDRLTHDNEQLERIAKEIKLWN